MVTKTVGCPKCKTHIEIQGNPGETKIITCPKCNMKGKFIFPGEMTKIETPSGSFCIEIENLTKKNGDVIISTLNRTIRSLLFVKIAAEYFLNLVPQGTHDWSRFILPSELMHMSRRVGLIPMDTQGFSYNILFKRWHYTDDLSMNYAVHLKRV